MKMNGKNLVEMQIPAVEVENIDGLIREGYYGSRSEKREKMTEEGREWLNSYKEIDIDLSTSRSEKTKRKSVEGDIKELSDVIKEVEGPEMLKTILMEHIEVVVQGNNRRYHRFVRLEAERRLKENENIESSLEMDSMEAEAVQSEISADENSAY
jgi:hypothetical protein